MLIFELGIVCGPRVFIVGGSDDGDEKDIDHFAIPQEMFIPSTSHIYPQQ